jgi:Flp pilus assembly CpaF family ATPase
VPRLSLRLPDGSRLFAVMSVSRRPLVSIRRHPLADYSLADLVANATLDAPLAAVLAAIVRARCNVVVSGGANTGKTQTLRALAKAIPPYERLVTIEDAFELDLDADPLAHPNVAALQAREPNIEGQGAVDMAELVRWGLRMNPSRVIVGEARGAEVIPLLNAMSQGNDGSIATIHASSSAQSAAQAIDLNLYRRTGEVRLDVAAATTAARDWLDRAGATGTVTATPQQVRVQVTATASTQLLSLVGVRSLTVHATATATAVRSDTG